MYQFLKNLDANQQIGAMFVLVFGLLLLCVIGAFLLSLRELGESARDQRARADLRNFQGLLKTSWLIMLVFWIGWLAGPPVALTLFGLVSFFALREFMTLSPTRRGDHRSLVLAFFVVLPVQYVLIGNELFNLFTVFIPVYVFLAIPVVSALANDPQRFLERNAKLQWGIMVCIYGMSHVPALLLLNFPHYGKKNAFLVFFLVLVVQSSMIAQHLASRRLQKAPAAPDISQSFNWPSWWIGITVGSLLGRAASRDHPVCAGPGVCPVLHCLRRRIVWAPADESAQARPRHSDLARPGQRRHRGRGLARPGRRPVFCRACVLSLGSMVFWAVTLMNSA